MNRTWNLSYMIYALVVLVAMIFSRLIPHPWNFTAIGAGSFFLPMLLNQGGLSHLPLLKGFGPSMKRLTTVIVALIFSLLSLVVSDLVLGFYEGFVFVYVASLLCVILGFAFQEQLQNFLDGREFKKSVFKTGLAQASGSLVFFVLTNFAVWLHSGMYSRTASGLIECYVMALPFLKWQLAGDLFYLSVFAAGFRLLQYKAQEDQQTI